MGQICNGSVFTVSFIFFRAAKQSAFESEGYSPETAHAATHEEPELSSLSTKQRLKRSLARVQGLRK